MNAALVTNAHMQPPPMGQCIISPRINASDSIARSECTATPPPSPPPPPPPPPALSSHPPQQATLQAQQWQHYTKSVLDFCAEYSPPSRHRKVTSNGLCFRFRVRGLGRLVYFLEAVFVCFLRFMQSHCNSFFCNAFASCNSELHVRGGYPFLFFFNLFGIPPQYTSSLYSG